MKFPVAVPPDARVAHISVLPEFERAQSFARNRWCELEAFAPGTLVGYGFDLQRLADKVNRAEVSLTTVDRAIFVLTDCGNRPITDVFRVTLWQTFGVPVYELIIAPGCTLLASECEAHDGWHLKEGASAYLLDGEVVCDIPPVNSMHTGLSGQIDTAPCGCGRPTIRLKNLEPRLPRPHERHLAAIA